MNTAFIGLDYIVEITHPDGKLAASASQVRERGVIAGANLRDPLIFRDSNNSKCAAI